MENKKKIKKKIPKVVKKDITDQEEPVKKESKSPVKEGKRAFWGKLGNFVKKSIDCCLE